MHYEKFDDVMAGLAKKKRKAHLLMGNGFSVAYDSSIFSYKSLFDFVASQQDPLLAGVLGALKTKNFELMMEQLNAFLALLDVFGERSFFTMDRQGSPARVLEWQRSDRGAKVKKKGSL